MISIENLDNMEDFDVFVHDIEVLNDLEKYVLDAYKEAEINSTKKTLEYIINHIAAYKIALKAGKDIKDKKEKAKASKKSIMEVDTSDLPLSIRRALIDKYNPVPEGTVVFDCGDPFTPVSPIRVTTKNKIVISMFFNSLFFEKKDDALRKRYICIQEYLSHNKYVGDFAMRELIADYL